MVIVKALTSVKATGKDPLLSDEFCEVCEFVGVMTQVVVVVVSKSGFRLVDE